MNYIIKLAGSVLAGFMLSLGAVLTIVSSIGMILARSTDLLLLLIGSIGLIFFGLATFKVLGYKIKHGIKATLEHIFWFI